MATYSTTPLGTTMIDGFVPWNAAGEVIVRSKAVAALKEFLLDGGRAAWNVYSVGGHIQSIADTPAGVEEVVELNIVGNGWHFYETYSNSTA
jgi:hypothetical protein